MHSNATRSNLLGEIKHGKSLGRAGEGKRNSKRTTSGASAPRGGAVVQKRAGCQEHPIIFTPGLKRGKRNLAARKRGANQQLHHQSTDGVHVS